MLQQCKEQIMKILFIRIELSANDIDQWTTALNRVSYYLDYNKMLIDARETFALHRIYTKMLNTKKGLL